MEGVMMAWGSNPEFDGQPRDRLDEISHSLRNLQLLSIVNFLALLWIIYLLGGKL